MKVRIVAMKFTFWILEFVLGPFVLPVWFTDGVLRLKDPPKDSHVVHGNPPKKD